MQRTSIRLLALLLLVAPFAPAPKARGAPSQETAEVFAQELERIQRKMEQGNWKSARVQLERALESHAPRAYVLGHLGEIELILERCAYWEAQASEDLSRYFAGELLSSSAGSGQVKLRYEEGRPHDFVQRGLALVHQVEFSGPYSIELDEGAGSSVVVCVDSGNQVQVSFGRVFHLGEDNPNHGKPTQRWVQVRSVFIDEQGERVVNEAREDFTTSKSVSSASYKVAVSGSRVKAYFGGKRVLDYAKPNDLWGGLALPLGGPKGTIVVEGDASRWLERKRDEAFQAGWKEFEAGWKLAEHLPLWMRAALEAPSTARARDSRAESPAQLPQDLVLEWNAAVRALERDEFETVVAKTRALLGREPDLVQAALLQAQAWLGLKQKAAAIAVLAPCVERFPDQRDCVDYLARLYLVSGRFEDTLRTVQAAVAAGVSPAELQGISVTANKGLHGPTWSEKFSYDSRHYSVASDLSRETCRSVALELEETYRHVARRLGAGQHDETRKFQVFAFAGRASYLDYIEDVFGGRGESTQGMYSSYLKQLLVLDSEPRESFMHTVRHEGFHQYLDALLDEPPIWLNEGLAEYFAASRTPQGSWRDGRIEERRLSTLRGEGAAAVRRPLTPLQDFFALEQEEFMRDGQHNYAQAWAFVHFLRHSTVQNEDRFQLLLKALLESESNALAIERAFGDCDLSELDAELARHVEKL